MSDPLSVAGGVVGLVSLGITVAQSLYDYYTSVQTQYSDTAHTLKKLKNLSELLNRLDSAFSTRKFHPGDEDLVNDIECTISQCKECIEELKQVAYKFKETPLNDLRTVARVVGRRLAYPIRQSTLHKLEEDIDELIQQVSLALQLLQQESLQQIQGDVEDSKAVLDLIRASQISSQIHNWLRAPDATTDFREAHRKSHPGTGKWFIRGRFTTWLQQPRSFLWLNGFAGCGKSVLCSTAIEHAFFHWKSGLQIGIAFFYFSFSDESKQDASAMLRGLVLQLSGQLGRAPAALVRLHKNRRYDLPSNEELLDCLHQLVRSFQNVYIFLDALDESPREKHQQLVLQTIEDIRAWSESRLHLLVTSRDEVDIRESLEATPEETIPMSNADIDGDIALFVSQHLRNGRRFRKWKDYHQRIEQVLTKKANGVFRWVECQFECLAGCPASEHLLDTLLESLPRTLDETYRRMLEKIPIESRDYAQRIFTVLRCAVRPLTVPELIDTVAIELSEKSRFNPKRRLKNLDALQQVCPGLILIYNDHDTQESSVRIAHFSVQEYLESERIRDHGVTARFGVSKQVANHVMARVCLGLLLEPRLVALELRHTQDQYPFIQYAAHYWPHHYQQSYKEEALDNDLVNIIYKEEVASKKWLGILNTDDYHVRLDGRKNPTPSSYTTFLKCLGSCVQELDTLPLTGRALLYMLDARGGPYGAAIQLASHEGHTEALQLLLDKGADVNSMVPIYGTALHTSSFKNHIEAVRLLIDRGADVNARRTSGSTPLHSSSLRGYVKIVRLLLDGGADVHAMDHNNRTPLHMAASGGCTETVRMLLDQGADMSAQDKHNQTPLQTALSEDNTEIVQMLLDRGAVR